LIETFDVIVSHTQINSRYGETDQMGFVAHDSYLPWLEMGRAALLKEQGLDYRRFEAEGYWTPVLEFGLTFLEPARYDDRLTIITKLASRPSFRIRLDYEIRRGETLLATGFTVQGFVNRLQRPVRPPPNFLATLDLLFPRTKPTAVVM
jgi:acyl-CoA thioester hydrolase